MSHLCHISCLFHFLILQICWDPAQYVVARLGLAPIYVCHILGTLRFLSLASTEFLGIHLYCSIPDSLKGCCLFFQEFQPFG